MVSRTDAPEYKRMRKRLETARKAMGLTQAEVALQIGRPQSFVSKVESGERCINPIELKQLAAIYGQEINWFLDDDTDATQE
jgi:transcriptional regulator with XRE-family HTH domain